MIFKLESCFDEREKNILIEAHNIIDDMITEMENIGLEAYQGYYTDDWRGVRNIIKDLVT